MPVYPSCGQDNEKTFRDNSNQGLPTRNVRSVSNSYENTTFFLPTINGQNITFPCDVSFNNSVSLLGNLYLNKSTLVSGDLFMNGRTFINGDISLNGGLLANNVVFHNATINNNLSISGVTNNLSDVRMRNRLFVNGASFFHRNVGFISDVSINNYLYVGKDVSFNGNMYAKKQSILNGDVSMNSRLFVQNDVSFNGNMYTQKQSILNGDVSMNSRLFVQNDASFNGKMFIQGQSILNGDVSMNSSLFVQSNASFNGNMLTQGQSILNDDVSMNSKLFVANDVLMNNNLTVYGDILPSPTTVYTKIGKLTNGSNAIIVNDTNGIIIGSTITADGIPSGTSVTDINSTNKIITMSQSATLNSQNTSIKFTSSPSNIGGPNNRFGEIYCVKLTASQGTVYFSGTDPSGNYIDFGAMSYDGTYGDLVMEDITNTNTLNYGLGTVMMTYGGTVAIGKADQRNVLTDENGQLYTLDVAGNLLVEGHTNINDILRIVDDVSINSRLFVQNDASFNGNMYTYGKTILNGDVSMNSRLFLNALSLNNNLTVYGDILPSPTTVYTKIGTLMNGSNKININDTNGIIIGSTITADGIPSGTHVTNINNTTKIITMSNNATIDCHNAIVIKFTSSPSNIGGPNNRFGEIYCVKLTASQGTVYFSGTDPSGNYIDFGAMSYDGTYGDLVMEDITNTNTLNYGVGTVMMTYGGTVAIGKADQRNVLTDEKGQLYTLDVDGNLLVEGYANINDILRIIDDVSINSRLFVKSDVSFNRNMYTYGKQY